MGASTYTCHLGRYGGGAHYWNGIMSHFHYCDGQSYAPTEFGETDSTTGEWKIKTSPNVQYGNNGFFVLKDGNSGTDQSPNSNNFTVTGGTLTKTEDNPSNIFATMNPLIGSNSQTFSNGNNTVAVTGGASAGGYSTLGMSSGKYYFEVKQTAYSSQNRLVVGITSDPANDDRRNRYLGQDAHSYSYGAENGNKTNSGSASSYGNSFTTGDILGVALDLDNNKLYFSKNGTWQNSGDPTSGSTGTGAAYTVTAAASSLTGFYHFAFGDESASHSVTAQANFGNGYFGTTAVASAGTNASGNGIFEYDVPAGYTALSTKGLNL